jgi:hypothetical protein
MCHNDIHGILLLRFEFIRMQVLTGTKREMTYHIADRLSCLVIKAAKVKEAEQEDAVQHRAATRNNQGDDTHLHMGPD